MKDRNEPDERDELQNPVAPTVREATESDSEAIHDLTCELADVTGDAHPFPESVKSRLLELLEEPRAGILVAEVDGEVAGVVSYWIKPDLAHGDTTAEVPMLAVAERFRRSGVGLNLMASVRKHASEHGATLIELVTTTSNVAAREFYRSLGFLETDHVVLEFVGNQ